MLADYLNLNENVIENEITSIIMTLFAYISAWKNYVNSFLGPTSMFFNYFYIIFYVPE